MKNPCITFENFSFKYRSQVNPTLIDINLTIFSGEKILIIGPSGSGKSTLAQCINGLIPLSYEGDISGKLLFYNQDASKHDLFTRSKLVGTVLQDPDGQFVGLTVNEDIAFALENDCVPQEEMKTRVQEAAILVDIADYRTSSIHYLSGGQKQRVSLAGVMVDNVDILLFDEPLANLDPATGKYAIELIDQIHRETKKTIVVIEHRLEDVLHRPVDRVIVMDKGRIVSICSPAELLASHILEETKLRPPLYIKALKYAGCEISPSMEPQQLESIQLNSCKELVQKWYAQQKLTHVNIPSQPLLELKNLSFRYENRQDIFQNLNLTIFKGEMVSIVGKNGAGKSTLTKLICGFERLQSGKILLSGEDMTSDTIKERSLQIGMVMQNPNHMISKHMIYDEVALGLRARGVSDDQIQLKVEETLRICGLYPYRNWPISALSFGQKKRVTIASILVLRPEVIILDEPTAGQDFRHYTEMMKFLVELNRLGMTIIIITHDMHLMLEYTQRTIVIGNGGVLADRSSVEILKDVELLKQANLKETSLFELAKRVGIQDTEGFVQCFIDYDRKEKKVWQ